MQRLPGLQANDVTAGSSGLSFVMVLLRKVSSFNEKRRGRAGRICRPHFCEVSVHCDPDVHHRREKYSNVTPTYTLPSLINGFIWVCSVTNVNNLQVSGLYIVTPTYTTGERSTPCMLLQHTHSPLEILCLSIGLLCNRCLNMCRYH